jgi:hypothetical protein
MKNDRLNTSLPAHTRIAEEPVEQFFFSTRPSRGTTFGRESSMLAVSARINCS